MSRSISSATLATVVTLSLLGGVGMGNAQSASEMSFFVTSVGLGDGANLGGLEGADAHCAALATAAGSTKGWAAYLSNRMVIERTEGQPPKVTDGVSARDRIGSGPWYNAKGDMIASDVDELHSDAVKISLQTALDENGSQVNGRGGNPNKHDILTGSDTGGYFSSAGGDTTCSNWTSDSSEGSAIVGHHDRVGINTSRNMVSWNSSHGSRGCGEADLPRSGGAGLFYCFATN